MSLPMASNPQLGGPAGHSYAAVLLQVADQSDPLGALLPGLRRTRLTGWVAPPRDGWLAIATSTAHGSVAAGRRGIVGLGETLAATWPGTTVALRVLDDRQLVLVAWAAGREVVRYVSDPSREPGAEEDVLPLPYGAEDADALAAACGRPDAGDELAELLSEPLDPDEEIESERLGRVLRLLDLPAWLVSSWRLPRAMATGPATRDLVRLRAGRSGPSGWVLGPVVERGRRWRTPPPVLADPPRTEGDLDDPSLWL